MGNAWRAALGLAVACLSGCGTAANLSGGVQGFRPAQIYGGVLRDVRSGQQWVTDNWTKEADWQQDIGTVVGVGLISLDVPFSAIGDTLSLPYTIPVTLARSSSQSANVSRKSADPPPVSAAKK